MSHYSTDSDDETISEGKKLFGRQKSIHEVLGGGRFADVLLWKNINVSAALTIGITVIWFLFEVVEYNFVTLVCHISITAMLLLFMWCTVADFFNWNPPTLPRSILDGQAFHDLVSSFHQRFNEAVSKLLEISCGKDPILFILTIISLYMLSVIGDYFTFLNFIYFGFICFQTLPYLYNRYEAEVDDFVGRLFRQLKKTYRRFDSNVLNKIPRGPVKEKPK